MRVLFVCGGTGGHINPALAVAGYLKKQQPNAQILFAGSPLAAVSACGNGKVHGLPP